MSSRNTVTELENKQILELVMRNYLASRGPVTSGFSTITNFTNIPRHTEMKGSGPPKVTNVLAKIKRIARKLIEEEKHSGKGVHDKELTMEDMLRQNAGVANNIEVITPVPVSFPSPIEREMRVHVPPPNPFEVEVEIPDSPPKLTRSKKRRPVMKRELSLSDRVKNL